MEAVGRGSQAQGLWVLHISQPGRPGALTKVHEGQGQPGWGGEHTVAAHPLLMPTVRRATLPSPCSPEGGWAG